MADNTYNQDEKGFLIGIANIIQRILSLKTLLSRRITHASQDSNKKFIILLACISAANIALLLAIIYQNKSNNL